MQASKNSAPFAASKTKYNANAMMNASGTVRSRRATSNPLKQRPQMTAIMAKPTPASNPPVVERATFQVVPAKASQIQHDPTAPHSAPTTPADFENARVDLRSVRSRAIINALAAMPTPTHCQTCSDERRIMIWGTSPHEKNAQYIQPSSRPSPPERRHVSRNAVTNFIVLFRPLVFPWVKSTVAKIKSQLLVKLRGALKRK